MSLSPGQGQQCSENYIFGLRTANTDTVQKRTEPTVLNYRLGWTTIDVLPVGCGKHPLLCSGLLGRQHEEDDTSQLDKLVRKAGSVVGIENFYIRSRAAGAKQAPVEPAADAATLTDLGDHFFSMPWDSLTSPRGEALTPTPTILHCTTHSTPCTFTKHVCLHWTINCQRSTQWSILSLSFSVLPF